jgi:hypothetical protein
MLREFSKFVEDVHPLYLRSKCGSFAIFAAILRVSCMGLSLFILGV